MKTPEEQADGYAGEHSRTVGNAWECDSTRDELHDAFLAGRNSQEDPIKVFMEALQLCTNEGWLSQKHAEKAVEEMKIRLDRRKFNL